MPSNPGRDEQVDWDCRCRVQRKTESKISSKGEGRKVFSIGGGLGIVEAILWRGGGGGAAGARA